MNLERNKQIKFNNEPRQLTRTSPLLIIYAIIPFLVLILGLFMPFSK